MTRTPAMIDAAEHVIQASIAERVGARSGVPLARMAHLRTTAMAGDLLTQARGLLFAAEEGERQAEEPARTRLDGLASSLQYAAYQVERVYGGHDPVLAATAFDRIRTAVLSTREALDRTGDVAAAGAALGVVARDLDGTILGLLRTADEDRRGLPRRDSLAGLIQAALTNDVHDLLIGSVPETEPSVHRMIGRSAATIVDVLNDMVDADLTGVRLRGEPLEGLRWSAGTRWPPRTEKRVRKRSHEVEPGVLEVRR